MVRIEDHVIFCGKEKFVLHIIFNKKEREFTCTLPGQIAMIHGKPGLKAPDFPTMERLIREVQDKTIHATTTTKKVIRFSFDVQALGSENYSYDYHGDKTTETRIRDHDPDAKGYRMTLWYDIRWMIECNGARRFYQSEEAMRLWLDNAQEHFCHVGDEMKDDMRVIDWTEEREKFFAGMVLAYQDLIIRILDFMEHDEPALAAVIDSGLRLLPEGVRHGDDHQ